MLPAAGRNQFLLLAYMANLLPISGQAVPQNFINTLRNIYFMQQFNHRMGLLWAFLWLGANLASAIAPLTLENYGFEEGSPFLTNPPTLPNPSGCHLGLAINDFSCNANHLFPILVNAAPGTALGEDVYLSEVRLIVAHEWAADLDMTLISPTGIEVELSTDNGSGNDNYGNPADLTCSNYTSFISRSSVAACSAISIANGNAPFLGNFLPEGDLNNFNDGSNANGTWTLRICDDGQAHYGTLEFLELVFSPTACLTPSSLTVLSVDSTSAVVNWSAGGNCTNTIIEYGPPGFVPGTGFTPGQGTVKVASCPPVTLTGLSASSNFDIYVREFCGGSDFSANSCKANFSTKCSPPPATLVENFNGQGLCTKICGEACPISGVWANGLSDHFDWIISEGPTGTTLTGPTDDVPGGGRYAYIETSGSACQSGKNAFLVSRCVAVHANPDSCDFSFNYIMYGVHVNKLALEITTNGGMTWQPLWSASGNLGPAWRKKFIDLSAFDGQVVQFRFVGIGGNGFRGDIAIDNLVFYGSTDGGVPDFTYYLDEDGDGYGQTDVFMKTCQTATIPGYVAFDGDCDDSSTDFSPGLEETPCDGVDVNCNGMDDEIDLPPPAAFSDIVCSGSIGFVTSLPGFGGTIHWYGSLTDSTTLHIGNSFSPQPFPENNTNTPVVWTFYAEETLPGGCVSTARSAATITVLPNPDLSASSPSPECAGTAINLNSFNITDANSANGTLTFYQNTPLVPANEIAPLVQPMGTTTYYVVSTGNGGCRDSLALVVTVKPSPQPLITGDTAICLYTSGMISVLDLGNGIAPFSYLWNNGSMQQSMAVASNALPGMTDQYAVTVTSANGCMGIDSLTLPTVTGVDSVQIAEQQVSVCNGNDGAITLTPLDGTGPYTYTWEGGSVTSPGAVNITNLSQGTYSFTITDSSPEGCVSTLPVIVLNGPSAVVTIDEVTPVHCAGGADGCIEISVFGTTPSILWSNGSTSAQNCGLAAGTYSVTVTDGGCVIELDIPVAEPAPLVAFPTPQDVSCTGGNNGKITLSVFGGTPPYQFLWSNGIMTQNIGNLTAGAYTVSVTDARGCEQVIQNIFVKEPSALAAGPADLIEPSCFGLSNGEITIAPTGGTSPYSILWGNGATGTTNSNLAAGNYSVSVTDAKGCHFSETLLLQQPQPVVIQTAMSNPICKGIDNGTVSTTTMGGNGIYFYNWNTGQNTPNLANLAPGDYLVTVTDLLGCSAISDTVTLIGPENFEAEIQLVNPTCVGINNGSLEVTGITGGIPPFSYYWSDDESGTLLPGLPGGTYSLTVTDVNGCQLDTVLYLDIIQPIFSSQTVIQPACHGTATGQISLTISGSIQPYNIMWSTGQSGSSIAGLPKGNYMATITDDIGCKLAVGPIALNEPPLLQIGLENIESIACFGGSEGSIDITPTGGTPIAGEYYDILWSNGATTQDLTNLPAGTYFVTITDAKNCVAVSPPLTVSSADLIEPSASIIANFSCNAIPVDTVCINVVGGIAPYSFLWSNGLTAACLVNVPVGDYTVTITDAAGCTQELMSVKVPEFIPPVTVQQMPIGNQSLCAGEAVGSLSVQVQGGNSPYQYIWSNGDYGLTANDTLSLYELSQGEYNVTITDNLGCTAVSELMPVVTYELLKPTIPGNQIQHVSCKLGSNGAINMNVTGGLPPYYYLWTNENGDNVSASQDPDHLTAGHYHVVVSDSIGCVVEMNALVTQPQQLISVLLPLPIVENVSCVGNEDGTINITTTGGVPPYNYMWSNLAISEDLQNLPPGTYSLTITDANLCAYIPQPFEITEPANPVYLVDYQITAPSCNNISDGMIDVNFEGGVPPYTYNWDLPSTQEDLFGIPAGTYHLVVLDANLCSFDTTFIVDSDGDLDVTLTATPSSPGQSNGTAIATASGGAGNYTFLWSNGQTGSMATNLPPGPISVTVTDVVFCKTTATVVVPVASEVFENQAIGKFSLFPNPSAGAGQLMVETTAPVSLEIAVINPTGQKVFFLSEQETINNSLKVELPAMSPGVYWVTAFSKGEVVFSGRWVVF